MAEIYHIGRTIGEHSVALSDLRERIERLEKIERRIKHWLWRGTVLVCIWAWPAVALLKGPDLATSIASLLKAALTK